ncbi:porin [Acinetobacter bereziniae]|uniref:porin n=1 Tax=Acinetobacter TaxID=469 RepID=UPI0002AE91FB|nr:MULTISPECIES: porin [Acinetobacter]ELW86894.1 general bacterial porin family protein [Acinetobacter sp. WC-743]MBJ8424444.1 porin [Acinetobacter bereziniae]MBJ8444803.1 porin [Acinetobacter bereziniae]MBJ8476528.1 porin [Acinetobacter bereziniae]NUF63660.1 porin [Acinetobacter bereziniae]
MKKVLLAAAITTLSISAAQAAPTLYGKFNVSLDQIDKNKFVDESVTNVTSNNSRIGIKGEEKLTDKLSALYLAEWQVNTDGDGTDLSMRNRYVGIKSDGIATLKVGRFDTYLRNTAGNNQDIFNDLIELDMTAILAGEDRINNVIGFETDKKLLGGLGFNIMFQQGEESSALKNDAKGQKGSRDGFGDGISTSLTYENKDYGLAAAVGGNFGIASKYNAYSSELGGSSIYSDAIRVTGSLDFKPLGLDGLVLGALWQTFKPTDDTVAVSKTSGTPPVTTTTSFKGLKENAYGITAAYAIPSTPIKLKAQYISSTTELDGRDDRQQDLYGVGADYNINKQVRFYGVVGQQKRDWAASATAEKKKTVVGLGMEYSF